MMASQSPSDTLPSLFEAVTGENPRQIPQPPRDFAEFRNLDNKSKLQIQDKFYSQPHIQEYLESKWKAELNNRSSFLWLWELYQTEADPQRKRALAVKLGQFKVAIARYTPYPALALDMALYKFQQTEENEVIDWNE